jgi:hypothetical protein
MSISSIDLILRSRAKRGVSKDGPRRRLCKLPSFETRASFDKLRSALLRMRSVCLSSMRPGARASLACQGIYPTAEDEALFEQMDRGRLTPDERARRILEISRAKRRRKAVAST